MLLQRGRDNDKMLVRQLQEGLAFFGFHPGSVDGVYGGKTEDAVEDWQEKARIYADGVFGPSSTTTWNRWCDTRNASRYRFAEEGTGAADPADTTARLQWVQCRATPMPNGHGFKSLTLRSDVATAYDKLLAVVESRGGYITTAGGKRGLSSKASTSRSKTSFHYTGRAFDLATYSALHDPANDPFLCVRDGDRGWQVWCRVFDETAPLADKVPLVTLEVSTHKVITDSKGRKVGQLHTQEWVGRAFNFTRAAASFGFRPIRGRKSFFTGGSYTGAEWWHFQWVEGLVQGQTTFGEELLKVYSLAECQKFTYWDETKGAVYGVSWL